MSKFLTEKLNGLIAYTPGEQPTDKSYVKLNTNESPYPPSKKAIRYAKKQLNKLRLYPDPQLKDVTSAISKSLGVKDENVIVTNGSDEVLNFAFASYCNENVPAVYCDVTYGFYKVFAQLYGVKSEIIPLKSDFTVDVEGCKKAKGTLFIANPNAPTGIALGVDDIESILKSDLNRIVVVDEAYIDFGAESCVKLIDKYDNLLVTQTFSKSRSMAGARLGFGVANKEIIADLNKIRYSTNPYNVNRVTAVAGIGALADEKYFCKNVKKIIETRDFTLTELKRLGFSYTDSKANFVFVKNEKISGESLYLKLKQRGVLVRHFASSRTSDYVRITIGSREEMQILINNVKQILEEII